LANGNFSGKRWCRDVDLVITNSKATANFYREKDGIESATVGPFVDPAYVVPRKRDPKHVVAINPSLAKGASIVAAVASIMAETRPDITFEIVQSRGNWDQVREATQKKLSMPPRKLPNVVLTANRSDMRAIYSRTKILLIFSLWWESLPRVAIEAALNGIPVYGTNRGGIPEAVGSRSILQTFDDDLYEAPYNRIPSKRELGKISSSLETLYDGVREPFAVEQRLANKFKLEKMTNKLNNNLSKLLLRC
jgi:glycosyltransferase involved in cell wall biosynthesis